MKRIFIVLLIGVFVNTGFSTEYKITKFIDIGPGSGVVLNPVKWSPNGEKLAFFNEGYLVLSDTLGNREKIIELDKVIRRYEWLSDKEIVIHLQKYLTANTDLNQLVTIDVDTREISIIKEYTRGPGNPNTNPESFAGPYKTIEGKVYYKTNVMGRDATEVFQYAQSKYADSFDKNNLTDQHRVMKYNNLRNFKIINSENEEVIIRTPINGNVMTPISVNNKLTLLMIQGKIHGINDSIFINVRNFVGIKPVGFEYTYNSTFCGEFNPVLNEVVTTIDFYNEKEQVCNWTGIFNFDSNELIIVDTLFGIEQSGYPSYNPNGRLIATQAPEGRIYIIYREEE